MPENGCLPKIVLNPLQCKAVHTDQNRQANVVGCSVTAEELAAHIKALKPRTVYLATDRGQKGGGHPVQELAIALENLLDCGLSRVRHAAQDHAARISGKTVLEVNIDSDDESGRDCF